MRAVSCRCAVLRFDESLGQGGRAEARRKTSGHRIRPCSHARRRLSSPQVLASMVRYALPNVRKRLRGDHACWKALHFSRYRHHRIGVEGCDRSVGPIATSDEPSKDRELLDVVDQAIAASIDRGFDGGPKIWVRAKAHALPGALAGKPPHVAHELLLAPRRDAPRDTRAGAPHRRRRPQRRQPRNGTAPPVDGDSASLQPKLARELPGQPRRGRTPPSPRLRRVHTHQQRVHVGRRRTGLEPAFLALQD